MRESFITLKAYREEFPLKGVPTLSDELLEILKFSIGKENASLIINQLVQSGFKFPSYLDQLMAEKLLAERAIPPTAEFTVEFWDNLDRFCSALVQYFSSDDGKRMKPQGPTGTTLGKIGGTDPQAWEQAPRKRGGRRRKFLY